MIGVVSVVVVDLAAEVDGNCKATGIVLGKLRVYKAVTTIGLC
jgi:NAD/NADP transhydrogenase alpha subunit